MNFGIIAAGEGSRLAAEGVDYPKPLVPINGEPMIGRLIHIMMKCGAEEIAIVVNDRMREVLDYLKQLRSDKGYPLEIRVRSTPSSMHTFHVLGEMLKGKGRFIATTVDTIFRPADFQRYVEAYAAAGEDIDGMMGVTRFVDDEKPLYVVADARENILAFNDKSIVEGEKGTPGAEELDLQGGKEYISGGIYGLGEKALTVLDECMERGVSRMRNYQRALVEAGLRLKAFDLGMVLDVDHASDIEAACNLDPSCTSTASQS